MEIKVERVTRIGGEASLHLEVRDGYVERGEFICNAPVRGFEKLLVGKNPFFAVEASMRICGICHASHGIACCEAIEHALGIYPPRDGLLLREACGITNRLQSHILQQILIMRDIFKEEIQENVLKLLFESLETCNRILQILGGTPTHPPAITIGGMSRGVPESKVQRLKQDISKLDELLNRYADVFMDEDNLSETSFLMKNMKFGKPVLASHLFYGDRFNIRVDRVSLEKENQHSTALSARYDGKVVEVGPLARLRIYRSFHGDSLFDRQIARVKELLLNMERLKEIMEEVDFGGVVRTSELPFRGGRGVGVFEAPRGTLIHMVTLDDAGYISSYRVIVPTMFNIPVISDAVRGIPVRIAPVIPRLFDPCIPCAVHMVRVR